MGWFGKKAKPEERREPVIRFVGEQDGPPERQLKETLSTVFRGRDVARAYLARVTYEDPSNPAVALCISGPDDPELVKLIQECFVQLFNRSVFLDIMFLSDVQEAEARTVCRPFYERANRKPF